MREINEEALALLRSTLLAVEPWADRFVVIGGWAMQLYRYLEHADSSVMVHHTKDVDFAVETAKIALSELPSRLRAQGLVAVRSRSTDPAQTVYQAERHGDQSRAAEYVEFLVPQIGRDDREAIEIAPGIGALTLRYLDLSFAQVRTVAATRVPFLADLGQRSIRVPSPASYVLAKALVYEKRKGGEKKDGDCAYLYWLARVTRKLWPEVRRDLEGLDVPVAWRTRGYGQLRSLFAAPESDGTVRAVRSIADLDHDAQMVHAVMRRFLVAVGVQAEP